MSETWKPGPWTLNGKATNASLLDAAGDLYEALAAINSYWASGNFSRDERLWVPMRAALAKARGE